MVIYLIACASNKLPYPARAEDIYDSTLFRYSLAYAKQHRPDAIYILSAKHGLLELDRVIEPYNVTLNQMSARERKAWAARVLGQLRGLADLDRDRFVFLAGQRYRENLAPRLAHWEVPLEGMRIGEQLQYLKRAVGT